MQQRGQGFLVQFMFDLYHDTCIPPALVPSDATTCSSPHCCRNNSQNLAKTAGTCMVWSFHFPGLLAGYTGTLAKHLIHPSLRYSNSRRFKRN